MRAQDVDSLSLESLLSANISTASKYEQTVAEAPASVTIITAEQIQRYGYRSLDEVLGTIRGFYLSKDRLLSYLGTRGFNRMIDYNNRVLVLLNGHTLNDRLTGSAPVGERAVLDLSMVDRVEVVRGPGSVLYGTGAMFAVVNIVTKQAPAHDGLDVRTELGSEGHLKSKMTFGKAFSNGLDLFATAAAADIAGPDLYFNEFDDPTTNNGIAEGRDWSQYYGGHVAARFKQWTAQAEVTQHNKGIPSGDFGTLFNHEDARSDRTRFLFEVKGEHAFGIDKTLSIRSFYDSWRQGLTYPFMIDVPALDLSDLRTNYRLETHLESIGVESIFRWDLRSDNRLIIGAEVAHNHNVHVDSRLLFMDGGELAFFDDTFPYQTVSFYAQDEFQVRPDLSLTFGLRQDFYSRTGTATTPRAALVYHPFRATTLKLLHGEAYREPSTMELYFDGGASLGGVLPIAPNANLQPERIRTTKAVWEQQLAPGFAAIASVYHYTVRDLVATAFNAVDSLFWFDNVSRVKVTGVEVELDSRINERSHFYSSYSYQHTRQYEPDEPVTNSPAHLFKAGLSVDVGQHATASTEVFYESERRTIAGTPTDAYWLVNLHLSSRRLWDHWRLSLLLRNALDTEYALPGSQQHLQNTFVQDGRRVLLRLSYVF